MSYFPLAGEHSKIYHHTITNADLSHSTVSCTSIRASCCAGKKMGKIFKERCRLCKVHAKLANSCQNDGAWLVKQCDKIGARYVRDLLGLDSNLGHLAAVCYRRE